MVFVTIMVSGLFVIFFFYHRIVITKFERHLAKFQAELDYFDEAFLDSRLEFIELEKMVNCMSYIKKTVKRGRPVNPSSIRQKNLRKKK